MMKNVLNASILRWSIFAAMPIVAFNNLAVAQPQVPDDYSFETLTTEFARLQIEATRGDRYGSGVLTASLDSGVLRVWRVSRQGIDLIAEKSGFTSGMGAGVGDVELDRFGVFDHELVVIVIEDVDNRSAESTVLRVAPNGTVATLVDRFGGPANELAFKGAITNQAGGLLPGLYLIDGDNADGEPLYHLAPNSNTPTLLLNDARPPDVANLAPISFIQDTTGNYSGGVLLSDGRADKCYALSSDLTWQVISGDGLGDVFGMALSEGGPLGDRLYVVDSTGGRILRVEPDGTPEAFATGLTDPAQVSVSPDGRRMYVTDANGIHVITYIECPADLDSDGDADADDFFAYLDAFAADDLSVCDIDGDGDCDADDFFGYLDLFSQGC